jgi:hypothetical protein
MSKRLIFASCIAVSVAMPASAANYVLTDGNSTATISDINGAIVWRVAQGGAAPASSPDNLFISNYLFRVGSTAGERSIAAGLGTPTLAGQSANGVSFRAANASLSATLDWRLRGSASDAGRAVLVKSVTFTNLSSDALDFHLFDYSDHDIRFNPAAQADTARLAGPGLIVTSSSTVPFSIVSRASVAPDRYQIDSFLPLYQALFLDSDGPTTLSNTPAPNGTFPTTPGDTAFAFQWSRTLAPGASFSVSQMAAFLPSAAVPEPASWGLMIAGFALMGGSLRSARGRRAGTLGAIG